MHVEVPKVLAGNSGTCRLKKNRNPLLETKNIIIYSLILSSRRSFHFKQKTVVRVLSRPDTKVQFFIPSSFRFRYDVVVFFLSLVK